MIRRLRRSLLAAVLCACVAPAAAQQCVAGFPEIYGDLFADAQRALPDAKAMVDAIPAAAPAAIAAEYAQRRDEPGFDLPYFIAQRFELPAQAAGGYRTDPRHDASTHIDRLWRELERPPTDGDARSSLLQLPHPYIVPGGRYGEIYYWDSYFTMLGLVESDRLDLVRGMVANFADMIDRYGHVPNGNRTYYLSRSQPPFFAAMVQLLAAHDGRDVLTDYLPQLAREYAFWMDGADALAPGSAYRRVVRLADGTVLNRYWDDCDTPRDESHVMDVDTAARSTRPPAEVYRNLRAGAESGWDFSSRWLADGRSLHTIRTIEIVPPDLNSLLHRLESTLAEAYALAGDPARAADLRTRTDARAEAIRRLLWDEAAGAFVDLLWREGRPSGQLTLATVYPLYFGIADPPQAARVAATVRAQLLQRHGLATSTVRSGEQWDMPNGWAPLQWLAIGGFEGYGEQALANDIAHRWIRRNLEVFRAERKLVEKYDVTGDAAAGGGEYPLQDGFGWTNGVLRALMARYPDVAGAR
ncbi:alpha,alpha-trehalase TreF [Luteimonas kalidii]|uniref:Alpha,alpha-trehalase TreF n=1 Tax=Luteimonas kalidii TaxID=3042025 RepID=A0ABT6JPP4_9GAMM|nr:alpha,alpha-trehalase TreF [Luteimonas kalidii]MDH5832470.1 alpha,alpha-trehalase TreF [Luteimonas kalidii]